jgi:hypothetical protein
VFIFYSIQPPLEISYIDVNFSVGDFIGLSHSPEGLNYGSLIPGMSSEKFIVLSNKKDFDVEILFFADDFLTPLLFGEKKVLLHSGDEMNYSIILKIPEEMDYGNYSGKMRMEFYKR